MAQAMNHDATEVQRSRRRVRGALELLNRRAEHAENAEKARSNAFAALQELDGAHPAIASRHADATTRHGGLLFAFGGVLVVDCLLFSQTAEYFAEQAAPGSRFVGAVALVLLPLSILALELVIARHLSAAAEERADGGPLLPYVFWLAIAVPFALVAPATAIATQLASRPADLTPSASTALEVQLGVLVVLSLGAHLVVMFSGAAGQAAKTWAVFTVRREWIQARARRHERTHQREALGTEAAYTRFLSLRDQHNEAYAEMPIRTSYFSRAARDVLRARAGYEVIRVADVPNVPVPEETAHDATQPAAQTRVGAETEADLSRDESLVRDADGEVRP
jgi:hypothetical protein